MKSYLLDTNALLRYILNDNKQQASVIEKLFLQAEERFCFIRLSAGVFIEAVFILTKMYRYSKEQVSKTLLEYVKNPILDVGDREILHEAIELYPIKTVSFIDLLLAAEANQTGKTLVTFDKKLKQVSS
jgi:predicted nucleic-acid-binding protein